MSKNSYAESVALQKDLEDLCSNIESYHGLANATFWREERLDYAAQEIETSMAKIFLQRSYKQVMQKIISSQQGARKALLPVIKYLEDKKLTSVNLRDFLPDSDPIKFIIETCDWNHFSHEELVSFFAKYAAISRDGIYPIEAATLEPANFSVDRKKVIQAAMKASQAVIGLVIRNMITNHNARGIRLLIDRGLKLAGYEDNLFFFLSEAQFNEEVAKATLLESDININAKNRNGDGILNGCLFTNNLRLFEFIVQHFSSVECDIREVMDDFLKYKNLDVMRLLMDNKTKIIGKANDLYRFIATIPFNKEFITELLENSKVDVMAPSAESGIVAEAIFRSNCELLSFLIEKYPLIIKNSDASNLNRATLHADKKTIRFLIDLYMRQDENIDKNLTSLIDLLREISLRDDTDDILREYIDDEDIESFKKTVIAKKRLALIYSTESLGTSPEKFEVLFAKSMSRIDFSQKEKFVQVDNIIRGENIHTLDSGEKIQFMEARLFNHAAYFVIKYDENDIARALSYCDGNLPALNDGYGVLSFALDPQKIKYDEWLHLLQRSAEDVGVRSPLDIIDILRKFVQYNEDGSVKIIKKSIASTSQDRGNCTEKARNIAMRYGLQELYPEMNFDKKEGEGHKAFKAYKKALTEAYLGDIFELSDLSHREKIYYEDVIISLKAAFLQAVSKGHFELIEKIEEIFTKLNIDPVTIVNSKGENYFFIALASKKEIVKKWLTTRLSTIRDGNVLNESPHDGISLLKMALIYRQEEVAQKIISILKLPHVKPVEIDSVEKINDLLLLIPYLSAQTQSDFMEYLFEKIATTNLNDDFFNPQSKNSTFINLAMRYGDSGVDKWLLQKLKSIEDKQMQKEIVNKTWGYLNIPLLAECVMLDKFDLAKELLKIGVDVRLKDRCGHNIIATCFIDKERFDKDVTKIKELLPFLIEAGAELNPILRFREESESRPLLEILKDINPAGYELLDNLIKQSRPSNLATISEKESLAQKRGNARS